MNYIPSSRSRSAGEGDQGEQWSGSGADAGKSGYAWYGYSTKTWQLAILTIDLYVHIVITLQIVLLSQQSIRFSSP